MVLRRQNSEFPGNLLLLKLGIFANWLCRVQDAVGMFAYALIGISAN